MPPTTFYRWYDRYREVGPEGLEDRSPRPGRVWNRIPESVRERILALALEAPELSPRERQRVRELFEAAPRRRQRETPIGSVIGLVSALAILGLMTWALAPGSPVSPDLMQ